MQVFLMPADRDVIPQELALEGKKCVEVGSYLGEYAKHILASNPAELWMIDPWEKQPSSIYPKDDYGNGELYDMDLVYGHVMANFGKDPRVKILREKSFSAATKFSDVSMDFVYIDAIHTFESCLMDMTTWFPKVAHGGWFCGHDYNGRFLGVRQAVDTFCRLTGQSLNLLTKEPEWATWGIRKA